MEKVVEEFLRECDNYRLKIIDPLALALVNEKKNIVRSDHQDFERLFYEQSEVKQIDMIMTTIALNKMDDFYYILSLVKNININIRTSNDIFLRIAIRNQSCDMIKYLLEQGLDVCAEDNFAIKCACMYMNSSKIDYIRLLIDHGADYRINNDFPICCAAYGSRWDTIKLLVELGCDINAGDGYIIEKIIFAKKHKMLRYAANVGGDLTNNKFINAAIFANSHKCLKMLMDCGADVSTVSRNAMVTIIKNGHSKIIQLLINAGLDFSLVNGYKTTKKSQKTTRNLALLTEAGVDPVTICHIWSESNNSYGTSSGDSSNEDWFSVGQELCSD